MEFLIDQNGYLRARWIPSIDHFGWSDTDILDQQISALNREKTKMPFPEDYVR
jgi:putative copper resistance protein D